MARVFILSDFDNTFVESRHEVGGTFDTLVRVFRVQSSVSSEDLEEVGPDVVELTHHDLQRVSSFLARSPEVPGLDQTVVTLKSGLKIRPSQYSIRVPESYLYFGAIPDTDQGHWLLEDLRSAGANWKGPFFKVFQDFLNSEEGARQVGILTARGHAREVWHRFFTRLRDQGEIGFLPEMDHYHSVGIVGYYDRYAQIRDIPGRKVGVLREYALNLAQTPLTENDQVLSPDGSGMQRMHFLVFADDHPEILEKALELFQSLTRQMKLPVKFALFNSGLESQVEETGRPRFLVVKSDGSVRALHPGELKAPKARVVSCEGVFWK